MASTEGTSTRNARDDHILLSRIIFSYDKCLMDLVSFKNAIMLIDPKTQTSGSDSRSIMQGFPRWDRPDQGMRYCEGILENMKENLDRYRRGFYPKNLMSSIRYVSLKDRLTLCEARLEEMRGQSRDIYRKFIRYV